MTNGVLPAGPLRVGVVGATGNVGRVMLDVLESGLVEVGSLRAFASAASEGTVVRSGRFEAVVEDLAAAEPDGLDVALFSAGAERSREHADRFAAAGCIVVDNSSAFRMAEDVPLVAAGVNDAALADVPRGIVANPNCSTIQLVLAVEPLRAAFGLERMTVVTMQSTSGTGRAAVEELEAQQAGRGGAVALAVAVVYPHVIHENVLPHCDVFGEDGATGEELKVVRESRRIMGMPDLPVSVTCTRVPVRVGHSEAVHLELTRRSSADEVRELLRTAPGVRVVDDPAGNRYPMPVLAAGTDDVLVGRIRTDAAVPDGRGIAMFVAADNLRVGAATNAVRIVRALVERGST